MASLIESMRASTHIQEAEELSPGARQMFYSYSFEETFLSLPPPLDNN